MVDELLGHYLKNTQNPNLVKIGHFRGEVPGVKFGQIWSILGKLANLAKKPRFVVCFSKVPRFAVEFWEKRAKTRF